MPEVTAKYRVPTTDPCSRRFAVFHLLHLLLDLLHLFFHVFDFDAVLADVETQVGVDAHVLIGDPDRREERDQVAAPIVEQQLVMGDEQEEGGYVMAEAEFAGEEEKEFSARGIGMALTLADAVFARLAEDFFVGNRPGNAGDGKRQRKQPYELQGERHD